jgi:hypothetical protein
VVFAERVRVARAMPYAIMLAGRAPAPENQGETKVAAAPLGK